MDLVQFITALASWAQGQPFIAAAALVGSHARGSATAESDIDLVLLTAEPSLFLEQQSWLTRFGDVLSCQLEDWGVLQSLRVHYITGLEIEFGVAPLDWAALPPDPGTREVVRGGMRILHDPQGLLQALLAAVSYETAV